MEFDKVLTFDKSTDVYHSGVYHDEQQVVHLQINDKEKFNAVNIEQYGAPEQFYCSSEVYELHTTKPVRKSLEFMLKIVCIAKPAILNLREKELPG